MIGDKRLRERELADTSTWKWVVTFSTSSQVHTQTFPDISSALDEIRRRLEHVDRLTEVAIALGPPRESTCCR